MTNHCNLFVANAIAGKRYVLISYHRRIFSLAIIQRTKHQTHVFLNGSRSNVGVRQMISNTFCGSGTWHDFPSWWKDLLWLWVTGCHPTCCLWVLSVHVRTFRARSSLAQILITKHVRSPAEPKCRTWPPPCTGWTFASTLSHNPSWWLDIIDVSFHWS